MMQILRSVNVSSTVADVEEKYAKLIKESYLVDNAGNKVEGDAFTADVKKAFEKKAALPVFVATVEGKTKYIMALYGAGLWGPLWGYIALDANKNTVFGVDISHKGETPGLGAEIATPIFCDRFQGKEIFKANEFKSIAVVKPGKADTGRDYIDGISGGTITCQGVDLMFLHSLENYLGFLTGKN